MDKNDVPAPPEDFVGHIGHSPPADPLEPFHTRELPDRVDVDLWLRAVHCNARGFVHGGLI